jgi:hypothetical protein
MIVSNAIMGDHSSVVPRLSRARRINYGGHVSVYMLTKNNNRREHVRDQDTRIENIRHHSFDI